MGKLYKKLTICLPVEDNIKLGELRDATGVSKSRQIRDALRKEWAEKVGEQK